MERGWMVDYRFRILEAVKRRKKREKFGASRL